MHTHTLTRFFFFSISHRLSSLFGSLPISFFLSFTPISSISARSWPPFILHPISPKNLSLSLTWARSYAVLTVTANVSNSVKLFCVWSIQCQVVVGGRSGVRQPLSCKTSKYHRNEVCDERRSKLTTIFFCFDFLKGKTSCRLHCMVCCKLVCHWSWVE